MEPVIRFAGPHDAAQVQAIYAPVVRDTPISFELEVPTVAEMRARIEKTLPDYPWLVLDLDGRVAGYAYASTHRVRPAYRCRAPIAAGASWLRGPVHAGAAFPGDAALV